MACENRKQTVSHAIYHIDSSKTLSFIPLKSQPEDKDIEHKKRL